MADNKTKPTLLSPREFVNAVENPVRRADAVTALAMIERLSGEPAYCRGVGGGSAPARLSFRAAQRSRHDQRP